MTIDYIKIKGSIYFVVILNLIIYWSIPVINKNEL
jgi:hypothetical protein